MTRHFGIYAIEFKILIKILSTQDFTPDDVPAPAITILFVISTFHRITQFSVILLFQLYNNKNVFVRTMISSEYAVSLYIPTILLQIARH